MDLSKLPRLSETDKNAPPPQPETQLPPQPQPGQFVQYYAPPPEPGLPAQVWLSAILGIVFMMMGWTFARFMMAKLSGQPFNTGVNWVAGPKAGQPVEYFELQGYTAYTDTAIFLFGLAMVLEAVVLVVARRNNATSRILLSFALALTVGMVIFNVIVAGMLFQAGITPLSSILAIAFGGWMAMFEWQLMKQMLAMPDASTSGRVG